MVGWGLFNLMAWVAMVIVTTVASMVAVAAGGGQAGSESAAAVVGGLVSAVSVLLIGAILACGVYRVMLRPDEPAFLHLRIGPDEVRNLALGLLAALFASLAGAAAGGLGGALGANLVTRLVVGMGVLAVGLWVLLRFLLAGPWSFDERRLRLAAPLRATRGRVVALLGMVVLNACLIGLAAVTLWLATFVVLGLTTGFDGLISGATLAEDLQAHPGRTLAQLGLQILLWPVFTVLATAPMAAAYKVLRPA